jgi:glycine cleavage system aminomethyltransferase T
MGDGALTSLSGEKGYRMWGWDIDDSNTPDEVGLEHTVDMDTEFIGKAAIEEVRRNGVDRKLACLTMADHLAVPEAGAAVHVDGDREGEVVRSEYGFTIEEAIAFAYLPAELVEPGTDVEVETEDGRVAGTIREEPLFDPDGERMRA